MWPQQHKVNYGLLRSWLPQRLPWTSPPWSIQDETAKWSWNLDRYKLYSPKVDNYGWTSVSNGAFASDVGTHLPYACMGYIKVACVIHTSHIYDVLNHQSSSTDSWSTEALSLQIWSPSSADPSEAAGIRLPPWFSTGSPRLLPLKDVPVPGIWRPLGRCQDGWSSWIHLGQQKPQDPKRMDQGVRGIELRDMQSEAGAAIVLTANAWRCQYMRKSCIDDSANAANKGLTHCFSKGPVLDPRVCSRRLSFSKLQLCQLAFQLLLHIAMHGLEWSSLSSS